MSLAFRGAARKGRVRFASPVDLDDPRLRRLILQLAIPSVIGLLVNALYYAVDAVFVGHLGTEALAAVNIALPLFALVAALGEGLGVGVAASVGRFLGEKRWGRACLTASNGLALAAVVGAVMSLLLWLFHREVLALMGTSPELMPLASAYTGILAISCVMTLVQILCDFIAIAEGNTRFSMITLLGSFLLNMLLDPLFIFAFGWGVEGAAWATLVAKAAALAAYWVYFHRHWGVVLLRPRLMLPRWPILKPVVQVGMPATLGSFLSAIAFALMYRQAAVHGGEQAVAGIGIAARLMMLGYFAVIGFCLGAQAVISYSYGARTYPRLLSGIRFMLLVTTVFSVLYAGVMLAFPQPMVALFTPDAAVQAVGVEAVRMFHLCFAITGLEYVTLILLQSMGRATLSAVVGLAPQGYLLIPALLLLPLTLGVEGVLFSPALASGLGGVLSLLIFGWQMMRLRRRVVAG